MAAWNNPFQGLRAARRKPLPTYCSDLLLQAYINVVPGEISAQVARPVAPRDAADHVAA